MEIDEMRVGSTINTDPKMIKKLVKKAPEADSISVCVSDDELYIILYRNGKTLGKVSAAWALSAYDSFIEDVQSASKGAH